MSHHQQFSTDFDINHKIKEGRWRNIITPDRDITVQDHAETIGKHYRLALDIVDHLVFQYKTKTGDDGKEKIVYLHGRDSLVGKKIRKQNESAIPAVDVTFDDIQLKVRVNVGDKYERDCSCDSAYMKRVMGDIGHALRQKFHWAPEQQTIYLVMDNAGRWSWYKRSYNRVHGNVKN